MLLKPLLLLMLLGFSALLLAQNNRLKSPSKKGIVLIIPRQVAPYNAIVNSIKNEARLNNRTELISVLNLSLPVNQSKKILQNKRLIITIGAKSLDFYIKSGVKTPFIASFITDSAFSSLLRNKALGLRQQFVGGVSLEQPMERLAQFAKLITKDIKKVGVVLGPNSINKRGAIERQARSLGWKLNLSMISSSDNPVTKLRHVFRKSQLVIVIPDNAAFNRSLARWIITFSYKHKVPVVAYSKKYVEAGALTSLYSTPQQIGKQTAKMAVSYLRRRPKTSSLKLLSPQYFQIDINQSVNQAFGSKLPAKEVLTRQLYRVAP